MRQLIDRYLDAYNRMDVAAMLATMHREVVFENYTKGVLSVSTRGKAELEHLALNSLHLFSARRQIITSFREHGSDAATADIVFDGTFAIDLPNGVRAGQSISMTGRSEYRVREGLLIYIADFSE
jgi:hypothetical protein